MGFEEGEGDTWLESCSTGRSSNEGLEAWVAKPDGGFRMLGAPPTRKDRSRHWREQSLQDCERSALEVDFAELRHANEQPRLIEHVGDGVYMQELEDGEWHVWTEEEGGAAGALYRAKEPSLADEKHLQDGLQGRQKAAVASVASAISSALKLTPGTRLLVARAAELGASAALNLSPSMLEQDDKENAVGGACNRDHANKKGGTSSRGTLKGKKGKKAKSKGSKKGADKLDKEQVPPQQVDLSA